jgi:hypothetical protein
MMYGMSMIPIMKDLLSLQGFNRQSRLESRHGQRENDDVDEEVQKDHFHNSLLSWLRVSLQDPSAANSRSTTTRVGRLAYGTSR